MFKISEHLGLWIIRLWMFSLNYKIQMKDGQIISSNIVFPQHSPANQCYRRNFCSFFNINFSNLELSKAMQNAKK